MKFRQKKSQKTPIYFKVFGNAFAQGEFFWVFII